MLTPFQPDGAIDFAGARAEVAWFKERKVVRSIFARSGMGQMHSFALQEAKDFLSAVIEEAAGDIAILAGCAGEFGRDFSKRPPRARYLEQSIELGKFAKAQGASAAVFVLPMAVEPEPGEPMEEMIFDYYRSIDENLDFPWLVYQPPGIPENYRVTPQLLRRLLSLRGIRGMKLSSSDPAVFGPIAEVVRGTGFALICGVETYLLQALELGACGVIGGGCDTHPELLHAVLHFFAAGKKSEAQRAQDLANRLFEEFNALGIDHSVAGKLYMRRKGVKLSPHRRPPSGVPSEEMQEKLESMIDRYVAPYRQAVLSGELAV
jgi:dihydrodipicolinate synthase/N-acetylneuraminate lyase